MNKVIKRLMLFFVFFVIVTINPKFALANISNSGNIDEVIIKVNENTTIKSTVAKFNKLKRTDIDLYEQIKENYNFINFLAIGSDEKYISLKEYSKQLRLNSKDITKAIDKSAVIEDINIITEALDIEELVIKVEEFRLGDIVGVIENNSINVFIDNGYLNKSINSFLLIFSDRVNILKVNDKIIRDIPEDDKFKQKFIDSGYLLDEFYYKFFIKTDSTEYKYSLLEFFSKHTLEVINEHGIVKVINISFDMQ